MPDPNTFLEYHAVQYYIVFNPFSQWLRITFKITRSGSGFLIFTKIEASLPCHTPNVSTIFRPDPSTTFWDIVLYIVFGPTSISQWWRITFNNSSSRIGIRIFTKNRIGLSLSHTQLIHKISSGSMQNFLRYPAHKHTNRQTGVKTLPPSTFGGRGN